MNKLDKIIEEAITFIKENSVTDDPTDEVEWRMTKQYQKKLKSQILALIEEIVPEESNINYHVENGIEYLHQNDAAISREWEKGYNHLRTQFLQELDALRKE